MANQIVEKQSFDNNKPKTIINSNNNNNSKNNNININKQNTKNETIESICLPPNLSAPSNNKVQTHPNNVLSNTKYTKDKSNTSDGSLSQISQYLNQNNLNYSTIQNKSISIIISNNSSLPQR